MRLKEIRNLKGISQRKLGKMIGVAGTVVSKYERGICDPSVENLIKMAQIFNVSVDTLVGNDSKIVDITSLDKNRQYVINKVVYELNDIDVAKLIGYIDK
ncbi:MAG: helix-turn-helix transcriptional regulator [Clostridia bacterium]|nr:helix-turn-helix transcriptional regulator [Clostridia bacterium]